MEHSVALQVVAEALNIAIAKGCFNLVEVTNIVKALEELTNCQRLNSQAMTKESVDSVVTSWSLTGTGLLISYIHQAFGLLVLVASLLTPYGSGAGIGCVIKKSNDY
jgi:hypothetical protein